MMRIKSYSLWSTADEEEEKEEDSLSRSNFVHSVLPLQTSWMMKKRKKMNLSL
jgi:hypothetical protein